MTQRVRRAGIGRIAVAYVHPRLIPRRPTDVGHCPGELGLERGLMVGSSFFGVASAVARAENPGVVFLVERLPPAAGRAVDAAGALLVTVAAAYAALNAFKMGWLTTGQTTGSGLPLEWTFYPMPDRPRPDRADREADPRLSGPLARLPHRDRVRAGNQPVAAPRAGVLSRSPDGSASLDPQRGGYWRTRLLHVIYGPCHDPSMRQALSCPSQSKFNLSLTLKWMQDLSAAAHVMGHFKAAASSMVTRPSTPAVTSVKRYRIIDPLQP